MTGLHILYHIAAPMFTLHLSERRKDRVFYLTWSQSWLLLKLNISTANQAIFVQVLRSKTGKYGPNFYFLGGFVNFTKKLQVREL